MGKLETGNYLTTPEGLLLRQRRRAARRIHFTIDDIEPRFKNSMSNCDNRTASAARDLSGAAGFAAQSWHHASDWK
jgi:hypothetical protein